MDRRVAHDAVALADGVVRAGQVFAAHAERAAQLWHGRVKVIDGTGASAPDAAKNQGAYPQYLQGTACD